MWTRNLSIQLNLAHVAETKTNKASAPLIQYRLRSVKAVHWSLFHFLKNIPTTIDMEKIFFWFLIFNPFAPVNILCIHVGCQPQRWFDTSFPATA